MSAAAVAVPERSAREWLARIDLGFEPRATRTVLARRRHVGPLTVQSPFYPEGGCCHVYLLHPPGGIVGGDRLEIDAAAAPGASALVTTPSATKFYRSAGPEAIQRQRLTVAAGATLEWLPQETILFDRAHAVLETRVDLAAGARFVGWEILCLGRAAAREGFERGRIRPSLEVSVSGETILVERGDVAGGSAALTQPWGLAGRSVLATLVAWPCESSAVPHLPAHDSGETLLAATRVEDLLVVRALGARVDRVRAAMEAVWAGLRETVIGVPACPPRIWRT